MGINVKVRYPAKSEGVSAAQIRLEKDLRSCMRCKFFYGSRSQCIAKKCVREKSPKRAEPDKEDICFACPYRKEEGYCFPCMRKLLKKEETGKDAWEQEEKRDG